jgi:predicted Rossmann-fold nucleotide-binding protein
MDEIYETNTLIQTGKIADFPVVMMGRDFWAPLLSFMRDTMVAEGTIDADDLDRLIVTDSPDDAARCILHTVVKRFGLHWEPTTGPRRQREAPPHNGT